MNKQPKLMDASRMRDILAPHLAQIRENIFISNEIGILHGDPRVFRLIIQHKPPFSINDHRFGVLFRGEAKINFNLVDRHIKAGSLIYLGPGSIINPIHFSNDFEIYGIALFANFPMPFTQGQMPSTFNGQVRDFQLSVAEHDIQTAIHIIDTIWHIVGQADYHRPTVSALVAALMNHYDQLYRIQVDQQTSSREQTIFDRFIQLVNQNCCEQHQLSYYADRMCLSKRYLGTVIRQTSGITAKEWIDRALITYAKTQLLHSNKSVAQIADELNFPNPSFMCKFFKRITSVSPMAYRNE